MTQGKPKPVVSWLKNGQPLDTKRVNIRSTDRDSILFIRAAEREDSGQYEMCVKVDDFEDKAIVTLQIVGKYLSLVVSIRKRTVCFSGWVIVIHHFGTLVLLQSCPVLLPALRLWTPGASTSHWSGPLPQTMETQTLQATQCRRLTKRLG